MRKLKASEMGRLSVEEFQKAEKLPLVVVLDDVRSLYNVGSVFRTADAFAIERVVLCGITATPSAADGSPSPEHGPLPAYDIRCQHTDQIHKTALGAEDSVAWRYYAQVDDAIDALHAEGYLVYAIEQCEGSTKMPLTQIDTSRRYAVILGNEVKGVHQSAIDKCDGCLEIPQFGTKHSMNVSVTAGIVMWEFARAIRH